MPSCFRFAHQLTLSLARAALRRGKGQVTRGTGDLQRKVLASLPYQPTGAQTRAVAEIALDMENPLRMNRLLQGDVGSGKTLVAFLSLLVAVEGGEAIQHRRGGHRLHLRMARERAPQHHGRPCPSPLV